MAGHVFSRSSLPPISEFDTTSGPNSNIYYSLNPTKIRHKQKPQVGLKKNCTQSIPLNPSDSINKGIQSIFYRSIIASTIPPILDSFGFSLSISTPNPSELPIDISSRLSLCPPMTYAMYLTPTPNIYRLTFTDTQMKLNRWQIIQTSPSNLWVIFSRHCYKKYTPSDFCQFLNTYFISTLFQAEQTRLTILSNKIYSTQVLDSSATKEDALRRMAPMKAETYVIIHAKDFDDHENFLLIYKNESNNLISEGLSIDPLGYIKVGSRIFLNFAGLVKFFNLKYPLLTVEENINPRKPESAEDIEKAQIAVAQEKYQSETHNIPPQVMISEGRPIFCPKPIRPLPPYFTLQ